MIKTITILIYYNRYRTWIIHFLYLVDPASSHILVLKSKPCMSKLVG